MKILITGATGFIGRELGKTLARQGHKIYALSRNAEKAKLELPFPCEVIEGDLAQSAIQNPLLKEVEAVIHLAGENVGDGRWTEERKKKILQSRTIFTTNLLQSLPPSLKVFLGASAVGFYGNSANENFDENSKPGTGFLADVCVQWEAATLQGQTSHPQTRFVIFRTGVVLGPYGGALIQMLPPFQMGVGGVLGSGKQWMSWIHLHDLVAMYVQALQDEKYKGIYNAVAPEPVQNRTFTELLSSSLGISVGPTVPGFAIQLLYGEMGSVVLDSIKVSSQKIQAQGFRFEFPTAAEAIENCASPYRDGTSVFHSEQFLDLPKAEVFPFFAAAENLEAITPPTMSFQIDKMSTPKIEQGTLIDYKLKVHGVPLHWQTLIDSWQPDSKFVDTQLKGPYNLWHHTHQFEDFAGGTLMTDTVRYKLPVGKLGSLFGGSFVRGDVEKIFAYRRKTVPNLLPSKGR